jgi:hypothetical protein
VQEIYLIWYNLGVELKDVSRVEGWISLIAQPKVGDMKEAELDCSGLSFQKGKGKTG